MIKNVLHKMNVDGQEALMFWCPGCKTNHRVTVNDWKWNESLDKPTFTPSILVKSTRMTDKGMVDHKEWVAAGYPNRNGEPFDHEPVVCHSYVTDGQIKFLGDCTHDLAGQAVDIPKWEL